MSVDRWILGALFRPAETYHQAREKMRLGYWWILIAVLTLECVMAVHDPAIRQDPQADTITVIFAVISQGLFWFYLSAGLLFAAARLFRWPLTWLDALKYTGLAWAAVFAEDVGTFYWALRDNERVLVWLWVPFFLWYLVTLAAGIRRVSGLSGIKSALVAITASLPWRLLWFWLVWTETR